MRIALTEEQQDLSTMLRGLFQDSCPPTLVREMKETSSDGYPAELWKVLTKTGVFGLGVDTTYGGESANLFELGLFFSEAGRALCPTAVYDTLQFAIALERLGTAEQKQDLLPRLVTGDFVGTVSVSDSADARSLRPALTAQWVGNGWRLDGTLMFVGNAALAERILVTALTTGFPGPNRTIGVLVDRERDGITVTPLASFAGDKQSRLVLDGYVVPEADAMRGDGDTGLAADDIEWVANACLALQCMEMVGGATAVLERTVEYVQTRQQFNRPIASFQAAQHHVANMRISLEGARLGSLQAVWWLGQGVAARRELAIAKMNCSEAYKWITLTAHQLHGGMGYVRETDLHLWSERAKVTEIKGGTADIAAGWLQVELGLLSGSRAS